jgi:DNA ligase 1
MLAGDLGVVARTALVDGEAAVADIGLEPLRAVQPMLASTSESVAAAIAEVGEASVEWKLDGARIQVHRRDDDVRIYTRNLNDVTARLPEVVHVAMGLDASSFVLDGEVLGFLGPEDAPQAFQDTMSRFGRSTSPHESQLVPHFFDVLHLDGVDLIDEPLRERRRRLAELAQPHLIPGTTTDDPDTAQAVLDDALAHGHEGVMVKAAHSPYEAGRRGKSWRKVKPVHTLDLVVLGVEWGSGRRKGWLSNIHLGAIDPATGEPVMVGKTFKGMTDELLRWQTERFQELETHRSGHVVWVRPEQVVEIALDGAQSSNRYPGGVALRFARVVRYRDDKSAAEADTLDAVRALLPGSKA